MPSKRPRRFPPNPEQFWILEHAIYNDEGVVVLNKPAGWCTSGRDLDDPECVQWVLSQALGRRVWAVHQLDKDTSGINVFVTRKPLVPQWQARLRYPNATKTYRALVHGVPDWDRHRVVAPMDWDAERRNRIVTPDGQHAATRFRVIQRHETTAELAADLETGRTHQIRVHLAHLGFPLVGEKQYRDPPCERREHQALHAWRLRFDDQMDPRDLIAPMPEDWR